MKNPQYICILEEYVHRENSALRTLRSDIHGKFAVDNNRVRRAKMLSTANLRDRGRGPYIVVHVVDPMAWADVHVQYPTKARDRTSQTSL